MILTVLLVIGVVIAGVDLIRSHGQNISAWGLLALAIFDLHVQGVI